MPTPLTVTPWLDPIIDANGLDPRSPYFEWCWLPLVGPTSAWAFLRLTTMLAGDPTMGLPPSPNGFEIDLTLLARSLGIAKDGESEAFQRILVRLIRFKLARSDKGVLSVRRKVPWLIQTQLTALPVELQHIHVVLLKRHDAGRPSH